MSSSHGDSEISTLNAGATSRLVALQEEKQKKLREVQAAKMENKKSQNKRIMEATYAVLVGVAYVSRLQTFKL